MDYTLSGTHRDKQCIGYSSESVVSVRYSTTVHHPAGNRRGNDTRLSTLFADDTCHVVGGLLRLFCRGNTAVHQVSVPVYVE